MDNIQAFFAHVDKHQEYYIRKLAEAVAIPSISADFNRRKDVIRMGEWVARELLELGAEVRLVEIGEQSIEGHEAIPLPPIILATYISGHDKTNLHVLDNSTKKKTLCVYAHYDVQPARIEDGWSQDPFHLKENELHQLMGRGASDDKAPLLAWIWVLRAHRELGLDLPVNLKMVFEGMEESGSEGFEELLQKEGNGFFKDIDCVCISDDYWLGKTKPCLTFGLRGISTYEIEVTGPTKDLHSGAFGGIINEPLVDLIHIMSKLVETNGKILIPGIYSDVAPVTSEEEKLNEKVDFSVAEYEKETGINSIYTKKNDLLMYRSRFPSLSIHGIEGAYSGPAIKTVIPSRVVGKFSIRLVPNQDPNRISELVKNYIYEEFRKAPTFNKIKVNCLHNGEAWLGDIHHWNYIAGKRAIERVYNVEPDIKREGGSIPITLSLQKQLKCNILLLPLGSCDDGCHSINEKIDRRNYIEGIKVFGAYIYELSQISSSNLSSE